MHKLAFKKPVKSGVIGCETEKITQFRGGVPDDAEKERERDTP